MNSALITTSKSTTQEIRLAELQERNVRLFIKRDDLIHEEISGNKWRKLKYNVEKCLDEKRKGILTFGGAYSNHLVATAAAAAMAGLESVGIVRGEELDSSSNDTLRRCANYGMELEFIPRSTYDLRAERYYQEILLDEHPNFLLVPEGGANYYGIIGCQEIMGEIDEHIDHIFVAQGTTTTSCGILSSLSESQQLWGVSALKGFDSRSEMMELMSNGGFDKDYIEQLMLRYQPLESYHFGGYAKHTDELLSFIKDFYQIQKIKLDPVYTGKGMFALIDKVREGVLDNSNILFTHTGGIQGAKSIEKQSGISLFS